MFCSKCGAKISKRTKFCRDCGQAVRVKENSTDKDNSVPKFSIASLFKERIGRKHWILGILSIIAVFIVISFLIGILFSSMSEDAFVIFLIPLSAAYIFLLFSLHVRRLHDLNHSGWTCLVLLIPLINLILILFLAFSAGKEETNKYGKKLNPNTKLLDVLLGRTI